MNSSVKYRLRRGLKADLPLLLEGEIAYTTDEEQIYIGTRTGNISIGQTYADMSDAAILVLAKSYADAKEIIIRNDFSAGDILTLSMANSYTNDLVSTKQSPATTLAGYTINDAYTKTQVDNADTLVSSSAKSYTDSRETSLRTDFATADATVLSTAFTSAKSYADTQDASYLVTSKSYTDTKVANIVNSAPATLDTLNELATALGNDPNFAITTATLIGTKAPQATTYSKTEVDTNIATALSTAEAYAVDQAIMYSMVFGG